MYVLYNSTGKIEHAVSADSPNVVLTSIPVGTTPLYLDDTTYSNVWSDIGEYTIQNGLPVYMPIPDSTKLAAAKQAKIAELKQSFAQSLLNGFTSTADGTSRTYAIDSTAMGKWTGALSVINSGKGPTNITVKDFNGNQLTLTVSQFLQMATDGYAFFNNQEQHLWSKESDVDNAQDNPTVNSITW